jgi:hypothetical protein
MSTIEEILTAAETLAILLEKCEFNSSAGREAARREAIDTISEGARDSQLSILAEIETERDRQDAKWGGAVHDDRHQVADFATFIRNYVGWAEQMAINGAQEKARKRLVQVAALAVAAVESLDRKALAIPPVNRAAVGDDRPGPFGR